MANRYWVGGTDAWNSTAGTKWSLASDGSGGGEAVPTSADDVYFNAASGAATVTVSANVACASLNCTGFTGTLAGSGSNRVNAEGSVTLVAGMALSNFLLKIGAVGTLTSAGKAFHTFISEGTVTCADALNATNLIFWTGTVLALKTAATSAFSAVTQVGTGIQLTGTTGVATISVASGAVALEGATIAYSTATGGATFTASAGSVDAGNNTGWTFLTGGNTLFELGAF